MREIIDYKGNKVSEDFTKISCLWQYKYDTAEEALIDLIITSDCLNIHNDTYYDIKKIVKPIEYKGIKLDDHFEWGGYLFYKLSSHFKCLGETT